MERMNGSRKNKGVSLSFILLVLLMGCMGEQISFNFLETSSDISKSSEMLHSNTIIIRAEAYEATNIGVEISASDERIVIAEEGKKDFQPVIIYRVNLLKGHTTDSSFSFKIGDKSIPNGSYTITVKLKGEDGKVLTTKSFIVHIVD
jgi:hypothetical protein